MTVRGLHRGVWLSMSGRSGAHGHPDGVAAEGAPVGSAVA